MNKFNGMRNSALMIAAMYGYTEAMQLLINTFPADNKYICSHQKLHFSEVGVRIYSQVLQTICSCCTKVNVTDFE